MKPEAYVRGVTDRFMAGNAEGVLRFVMENYELVSPRPSPAQKQKLSVAVRWARVMLGLERIEEMRAEVAARSIQPSAA